MVEFLQTGLIFIIALIYLCIWICVVLRLDNLIAIEYRFPRGKKFLNTFSILWFLIHACIFLYALVIHWI